MAMYRRGIIFTRCFLQSSLDLGGGVRAVPLHPTGSSGLLHDVRRLLELARVSFTRKHLEHALATYRGTGHSVVAYLPDIEMSDWKEAADSAQAESDAIAGALAVVSANPVITVCSFADAQGGGGIKFFIPSDREIRHAVNVPGFRDAAAELHEHALHDSKLRLLLNLYRASLRESEIDNQILFQLVLLEEASDAELGSLAERVDALAMRHNLKGDLEAVVMECGLQLPAGKTVINLLVELRNAAAHNGKIDDQTLKPWAVPLVADKPRLHRVIGEVVRLLFCALVGKGRDAMAIPIEVQPGEPFVMRFD